MGAILATGFFPLIVNAALYVYDPVDSLVSDNASVTYTFDFSSDFSTVTAVSLVAWVYDDGNDADDRFQILAGDPLHVVHTFGNNTDLPETTASYSISQWLNPLADIKNNTLPVKIQSHQRTDFYFDKFELNVTGTVVPIPAAAWLLGTGLIALIGFRRFRRS
jgi:hypothetical protein